MQGALEVSSWVTYQAFARRLNNPEKQRKSSNAFIFHAA